MPEDLFKASLKYHRLGGRPGKLEVCPTKPTATQRDLSLAYSPGVAEPCREIHRDPDKVYDYTNKGNLVAVITNGTAVLGLGNIGPRAGKPVMEGKAVLFKKFADIDVFDIEVAREDPDEFIAAVEAIAPTFGGINLEDIKGPECFYIEEQLRKRLDIPVFHDDQHGTAIIAAAAFLNACELTGRQPEQVRCAFNGAGAAGIAVGELFMRLGVKREHILMCDSRGVIHAGRDDLSPQKQRFAHETEARTLEDALRGADCFIGCSVAGAVTPAMLSSMGPDPIVFAMANPEPEIPYELARQTRADAILATGRSDHPNQVNNVLGFPFIFRGALDCAATDFNEEMKLAAVYSLAALAKESVPEVVSAAYGGEHFAFGRDYLIPKPFDPRVLYWVSVAVAEAAMKSGVARRPLDLDDYRERLRNKVDAGRSLISVPLRIARGGNPARLAIPEGQTPKLASVIRQAIHDGIAFPVVVGPEAQVRAALSGIPRELYEVEDPDRGDHVAEMIAVMRRQRPLEELPESRCREELRSPYVYATLLCELGLCDGLVGGSDIPYAQMVRPILRYASRRAGVSRVAGMHLLQTKERPLFFADTTLIPDPSAEELAEIAMRATRVVRRLNVTPRVAFISYANFSSRADHDITKLRRAYKIVRQVMPELEVYRDVQLDVALDPERYGDVFGDRIPKSPANILIFPNLHAANAAYRLARVMGGQGIGPMLLGLRRPANVLPRGSTAEEILNMLGVTAYNAKRRRREMEEGHKTKVWRAGAPVLRIDESEDALK